MTEEENKGVETEVSEAIAQAPESNEAQEEAQETPEQRRQRNDAEYNWAEMRRHMREKEREIAELKDQFSSLHKKPAQPEEDEFAKLAEDDILTVSQAKRLATKYARQATESVLRERDASTVDERLQFKYPDFMSTVTKENIELLKETKPQLAKSLLKFADDPFQQSELAYEYIKNFVPQRDESMNKDKKKALENAKKPVSVQSVGKTSAIGQVHQFENGLTPELKSQLYKEMQNIRKGA
jgi:hypothetical protein